MDRNCKNCKLGCGKAVPGYGPEDPKLIVISDYPGRKEEEYCIPLIGESGQLMRKALMNIIGLDPEKDVFYTNAIRCRPGEDGVDASHINACKRWTNEELKRVNCDLILIAGSTAFEALLPQVIAAEKAKDKKFNISKAHGSIYRSMGKTYMVTWNPAYVEGHKFKDPRNNVGSKRKPEYVDWYPTGSIPSFFIQDMNKLKVLIDEHYNHAGS